MRRNYAARLRTAVKRQRKIGRKIVRVLPTVCILLLLTTIVTWLTLGQDYQILRPLDNSSQEQPSLEELKSSVLSPGELIVIDALGLNRGLGWYEPDTETSAETENIAPTSAVPTREPEPEPTDIPEPTAEPTPTSLPTPTPEPTPTPYPEIYDNYGIPIEGMPVEHFHQEEADLYVQVGVANIRQEPHTDSPVIRSLTTGETLYQLGYGLSWTQVRTNQGETGFVLSSFVTTDFVPVPTPTPMPTPTPTPAPTPSPPPTPTAAPTPTQAPAAGSSPLSSEQKQAIISLAESCIGVRYLYGGSSMSGFDCSGFVRFIYLEIFNITLPHRSYEQARLGNRVSSSNIDVGDIICFDWSRNGTVDHVGLYIGGGEYIHASSSRGRVVRSTVDFSRNPIVTIRRIIN